MEGVENSALPNPGSGRRASYQIPRTKLTCQINSTRARSKNVNLSSAGYYLRPIISAVVEIHVQCLTVRLIWKIYEKIKKS